MSFPPLLVLGTFANIISVTLGMALLMLVLWQSRQLSNLLFSLFLLAMICVGFSGLVFRYAPQLHYDPTPWLYILSMGVGAYGVSLFIFTTQFTGKTNRLVLALDILGVLLWAATAFMTWNGLIITNVNPTLDGRTVFDFTTLGYIIVGILIAYELLALISLLYKPTERSLALAPGAAVLVLAAILDLFPVIAHLPVNSVMTAIAAVIMGRQILNSQLFDPIRRLNLQLERKNEELADASKLKSQFLANMSHELRTPLNSIIGYSELILDGMYGPLTEKQQDRLEKVHRNGKNLLALINDILDLSKIEAGRMELDLQEVEVPEVIEQVMAVVQPMAQEKGLTLESRIAPNLRPVKADPDRLRQVILNLLSNAVKFTAEGSVTVDAGATSDSRCLELKVIDSGIGIAPDLHEVIFDEFRQADSTSTREFGGTGLGLAISRRLSRLHGGDIIVESAPGKGSTFTVTIPLVAQMPAGTISPESPGPLVLIIDDQVDAADLIREHLTASGYRVHLTNDGADGIRLASELQPDAITLDLMMPGMDGWQVLKQLHDDQATTNIPIIIVSIIDESRQAVEMGARDYIMKPINPERLLAALRRTIASPTSVSATN